jgi:hypothetical protein
MTGRPNWKRALARVVATLLAMAFVVLMPVTLLARSMAAVLFSPDVVVSVLTTQLSLAEDLRRPVFSALLGPEGGDSGALDMAQALSYLTPQEQQAVLETLIPRRWAEDQIDMVVSQSYAWLDNQDPFPTITLDVQPIKLHLLDSAVQASIVTVVDSWPDCTGNQLASFAGGLLSGTPEMIYCSPPGALGSLLTGFLITSLKETVQALPPEVTFTPGGERPQEMLALKQDLRAARALGRWAWMVPVCLLLLILGLVVRSLPAWGRWWGWPLMGAGLLTLGSVLWGGWAWGVLLGRLSTDSGMEQLVRAVNGVLQGLAGEIMSRQILAGLLSLVVGVGMLVMARVLTRRRRRALPPAAGEGASGASGQSEPRPSGMFG